MGGRWLYDDLFQPENWNRAIDTALGQALLGAASHRRLWLAGRAKIDDWAQRPAAELHLDDAAWVD